ncbi:MAG: iron-containing alcohol dehydrogenase [Candidatus Heimdallarchaeota archaeon]
MIASKAELESVEVPRQIVYGEMAVEKLPEVCNRLGIQSVVVVSGPTATRKIAQERIIPLLDTNFSPKFMSLSRVDYQVLEDLREYCKSEPGTRNAVIAVGGGNTFDPVKVATSWGNTHYISVPTSSAHDGFASPYINFRLRLMIDNVQEEKNSPAYVSHSPLGIILNIQQGKNLDWHQPALNVWSITYDYRNDQQDYHIIAIFYFRQEADGNLWKVEGEGLPTLVPELWKALQGAFQEA